MKKIIGIIHPFDVYQTFCIYEDEKLFETIYVDINDIPDTILQLSNKYKAYQVDLSGAEQFIQKIITQIQEKEATQYNKNKLTIKCI